MRVLQLIDSLHAGGAERVAVNYANALSEEVEKSYLCCTREEGVLNLCLNKPVDYLFLNKKKTIDKAAIDRLAAYIKTNRIDVIHAHGTSFFLATLVKFKCQNVSIIWHDHNGNREKTKFKSRLVLKFCIPHFSHIFCVSEPIKNWLIKKYHPKNIEYLQNFPVEDLSEGQTVLKGDSNKRIVHLANLRSEKDHNTLLKAFSLLHKKHPDWTLHCIGKIYHDHYFNKLIEEQQTLNLEQHVFFYDNKSDISHILAQSNIGVLSSVTEGLPMALLEYGMSRLPVVVTNVGECAQVVEHQKDGLVTTSEDVDGLSKALSYCIDNKNERQTFADNFYDKINLHYSKKAILKKVIIIYKETTKR